MSDNVQVPMQPWMHTGPHVPCSVAWTIAEAHVEKEAENGQDPVEETIKFLLVSIETPTGSERLFFDIKRAHTMFREIADYCAQHDMGLTIAKSMPDPRNPNAGG